MIIDQTKASPFFDYIDNETDDKLRRFIEARYIDTEEVMKVAKQKMKELIDVIAICEELEGKK